MEIGLVVLLAALLGYIGYRYYLTRGNFRPRGRGLRFPPIGKGMVVDQATMDYFQSTAPDPTQDALDRLLQTVTRVRIVEGGVSRGKAIGKKVLLDTNSPADIDSFRECFGIVEDP